MFSKKLKKKKKQASRLILTDIIKSAPKPKSSYDNDEN